MSSSPLILRRVPRPTGAQGFSKFPHRLTGRLPKACESARPKQQNRDGENEDKLPWSRRSHPAPRFVLATTGAPVSGLVRGVHASGIAASRTRPQGRHRHAIAAARPTVHMACGFG